MLANACSSWVDCVMDTNDQVAVASDVRASMHIVMDARLDMIAPLWAAAVAVEPHTNG